MTLMEIIPGRSTGMVDIDGVELFDGDMVDSLNTREPRAQIRMAAFHGSPGWSTVSKDGGMTGLPSWLACDPRYGVRKVKQ